MANTLTNIEFKTSSATGSTQRQTTGEGLANLLITSLESANKLVDFNYTQNQRKLAEENRIKSQNEEQDYLYILDAKAKIQQKSKDLIESKANAEDYSNQLNSYIDTIGIDFSTEKKKLEYSNFINTIKEDNIDKKNVYAENLAIDKSLNLLEQNVENISDIEEFFNNTMKNSLYKKNEVEVRDALYKTYGNSVGLYLEQNENAIFDKLVSRGKLGNGLTNSYLESKFPALKTIKNPTIQKAIASASNVLDKKINDKIKYNNLVSTVDRLVAKGDYNSINSLMYTNDETTRARVKDLVVGELNTVNLGNEQEFNNALKLSSLTGIKIDKLDNRFSAMVSGNMPESSMAESLLLWQSVKSKGYKPRDDIGSKLDELSALKSIYASSEMSEADQWSQTYNLYREGKKHDKLSTKTIDDALKPSNMFSGSIIDGYESSSNSQFESILVDRVKTVMQYSNAQDNTTIQNIAKTIAKEMNDSSVEVNGVKVPYLNQLGNSEEAKNASKLLADTYVKSIEEKNFKDVSVDYLNYSPTQGHRFIVKYKDLKGNEITKYPNIQDIQKDVKEHTDYIATKTLTSKEDNKLLEVLKKQDNSIRESIKEIANGTFDWRGNLKLDEQMKGIASVGETIQKVKDFYTGEFLQQFTDVKKDEKLFQLNYDNKISNKELEKLFGIETLEEMYNSVDTRQGYDLIDENKGALKGGITDDVLAGVLGKKVFDMALPTIIKSKQAVMEFFKTTKDVKLTNELNKEIADSMSSHMGNVLTKVNTGEGVTGILAKQEKNLQKMNEKIKLDKFNTSMEKEQSIINLERKIKEIQQAKYNEKFTEVKNEIDKFIGKPNATREEFVKAKDEFEAFTILNKNWDKIQKQDYDFFQAFEKVYGNKIGLDLQRSSRENIDDVFNFMLNMKQRTKGIDESKLDSWVDTLNKVNLDEMFK